MGCLSYIESRMLIDDDIYHIRDKYVKAALIYCMKWLNNGSVGVNVETK